MELKGNVDELDRCGGILGNILFSSFLVRVLSRWVFKIIFVL